MLDHVSPSQIDTFFRCAEQWRRRYAEGEKIPPGFAAHVGRGVHVGAEVDFRQKVVTSCDLPKNDIVDAAVAAYDKALEGGVYLTRDEAPNAQKLADEGTDTTAALAGLLADQVVATVEPEAVEERIVLDVPELSVPVVGIIDCYTKDARVVDFKTAARSWPASRIDTETQPTVYRKLAQARWGTEPDTTYEILVKTKTAKRQLDDDGRPLIARRTDDDWRVWVLRVKTMLKMVEAGAFPPAEHGAWVCSEKFCGFWSTCKHVSDRLRRLPNA